MKEMILIGMLMFVVMISGCTQPIFQGNAADIALVEADFDLPVRITEQAELTEEYEFYENYISPKYVIEGLENAYLTKYGVNTDFTLPDDLKDQKFYDATQVILVFPMVNETINTTSKFITGTEEEKIQLAVIGGYANYGIKLVDENGTINEHKVFPSQGIGDNEFVYWFKGDLNLELYGITFTKKNVLQKISIYGQDVNLEDLRLIAQKAAARI